MPSAQSKHNADVGYCSGDFCRVGDFFRGGGGIFRVEGSGLCVELRGSQADCLEEPALYSSKRFAPRGR